VPESGHWHDGTFTRKIEAFSAATSTRRLAGGGAVGAEKIGIKVERHFRKGKTRCNWGLRVRTIATWHPRSAWFPMTSDESVQRYKDASRSSPLVFLKKLLQEAPFQSNPEFSHRWLQSHTRSTDVESRLVPSHRASIACVWRERALSS